MSLSKDEITETFYTAGVTTLGAVGIGVASRKLTRNGLGIPTTPMPIAKLAVAAAGGSSEMKKCQDLTIGTLGLAVGTVGAAIIKAYGL